MALFWQKYFDTFASIFSRDLSKEAPDPTFLSGAGIGRADGIGTSEYLEGGSTFTHSVEIRPLNDFLEVGEHTDRRARYLEYDRLENIPEINSAINIYSDETTTPDIEGKVFTVICHKQEIKDELEWLFFDLLDIETEALWSWCRNLCKNGDLFLELVIDPDHPEYGVQRVAELPPETLYRIETVRGRLLEFQQSYLGPDYQVILNDLNNASQAQNSAVGWMPGLSPVTTTGAPLASPTYMQGRCIRFKPEQICHVRIGINRRGFYPYGVSVLYAARRIAHLLKLMEDAAVIYRVTRSPERRIFYIDVGSLPPNKGDLVVERVKDKIKKKKVFNRQTGNIDERYSPWSIDEDFFIATRPEANTRIETLPGAQNLDAIGDIKYFREKLMIALNLPKNFLLQEDTAITRTSYATQDMRFARTIYRIQKFVANGLKQIAIRHLLLKGYPEEETRKIQIKFTQPSDWLELSRSEILNNRYNLASSIKGGQIYDDYTILTKILKHTHEEALEIISRKEKELLRQQEIQAQAQVFAQLATPVEEPMGGGGSTELGGVENPPEMNQEIPSGETGELPGIPAPEASLPTSTAPITPKVKKPERYKDFEDLESDHEEEDLGY